VTFNRSVIVDRDDWIAVDIEGTRRLYAALDRPLSETCPCAECRGFTAHRGLALPDSFLGLLRRMGIDSSNEAELWAVAGPRDLYVSAEFDFVGEVVPSFRRLNPDVHLPFEYVFKNVAASRSINPAREMRLGPIASVRFGTTLPIAVHPVEAIVDAEWSISR
jgi:hypothetical protein